MSEQNVVYARVEIIRDPETHEHLGTIVWPFGDSFYNELRYFFDPGKEKKQLGRVPPRYQDIVRKLLEARGM